MRISTFLAAALRASSLSQPNSLSVIRYSSRNDTTGDHVIIAWVAEAAGHHSCNESWHATGDFDDRIRHRAEGILAALDGHGGSGDHVEEAGDK
jgi:hypothetical protein